MTEPTSSTEASLAGQQHRDPVGDSRWVWQHGNGNWTINLFAWVLRKVFRRCQDSVTYDHASFVDAMTAAKAELGEEFPLVIVPVHRSYFDFLFCSYLFHAHPELGIKLPKIAAAEEFGEVPILGHLLNRAGAFYIRRGVGKEDVELTEHVETLVAERSVFEFFPEGKRSRAREFLPPKRGLLRCLQGTGESFAILPIAISYDRRCEERALAEELLGGPKPKMSLAAISGWAMRLFSGRMRLGRIHIACGKMLTLTPDSDVKTLADDIMCQLQQHTVTSDFHLNVFAHTTGINAKWLKADLAKRGAPLITSDLPAVDPNQPIPPAIERSLRYQWQHYYAAEARAAAPNNPALQHWLNRQCYTESQAGSDDPHLPDLLIALYAPICQHYIWLAETLRDQTGNTDADTIVQRTLNNHPDADLTTLRCAAAGLVELDLFNTPNRAALDDYINRSHWPKL